jgi:hypothetical protein
MDEKQKSYLFYGGIGLAIVLLIAYFIEKQKKASQGVDYGDEVEQNIQEGNVQGTVSGVTGGRQGDGSNNIDGYTDVMAYNDAAQINSKFCWSLGICWVGTDEIAIANIIRGKTRKQLGMIQYEFQKLTGKTLDQAINAYCYASEKQVIMQALASVR